MSALDEMEHKQQDALPEEVQESLQEERIYAGEPEFQTESYQHEPEEVVESADQPASDDVEESEQPEAVEQVEQSAADEYEDQVSEEIELAEAPEAILPKAKPLNLDEQVPLLMDVEQLGEKEVEIPAADEAEQEVAVEAARDDQQVEEEIELTTDDVAGIEANVADMAAVMDPAASDQPEDSVSAPQDEALDPAQVATQAAYAPVKKPGPGAESLDSRPEPNLVLVTHVIPHDEEGFCGEDILYLVNSCDLRHGEKDIFHRFEQENGEGNVQFSMANSFNPGTFDPEALLHQRVHGVSLFMSLPGPDKAMDAFEAMTEMASVIARNLGGEVQDETHSVMAMQTIEHNRQQVRDFVRKQKLAKR